MTLNVTNGDSAVPQLRAGGVEGEILCWRDVLHDGPVPRGPWETVRMTRAQFLGDAGWARTHEVLQGFTMRDERLLSAAHSGEPIVLWFEHDLYDQLQLAQILAMLAETPDAHVQLAQSHDYLGLMPGDAIAALADERHAVDAGMLSDGASMWRALTSDTPLPLEDFSRSAGPLPLLRAAARRLLEEYPGSRDGLSRAERQALTVIGEGPCTLGEAYRRSHHEMEESIWMGDSSFLSMVSRLGAGSEPSVTWADGSTIRERADREVFGREVVLTPVGRAVLAGDADLVSGHGIDRWIGGVRLQGRNVRWRWDANDRRITPTA